MYIYIYIYMYIQLYAQLILPKLSSSKLPRVVGGGEVGRGWKGRKKGEKVGSLVQQAVDLLCTTSGIPSRAVSQLPQQHHRVVPQFVSSLCRLRRSIGTVAEGQVLPVGSPAQERTQHIAGGGTLAGNWCCHSVHGVNYPLRQITGAHTRERAPQLSWHQGGTHNPSG